jgi:hypothetical protein
MKWKKLVPSQPYETTARTACDFCGDEESGRGFDRSEVTIEAKIGEIYPEVDTRQVQAFDCCPKCWESKVVPALVSLGGRVYEHAAEESRVSIMPFDPTTPKEK